MKSNTEATIKALRDAGILPEATAAAFLPAPRRKAAPCRNYRGSALRPEGACTAPAYRIYEKQYDGKWVLSHNVCEKCLPLEAEYLNDEDNRVTPIA